MRAITFPLLLAPTLGYALTCPVDELASFTWGNPNADAALIHVDADYSQVSRHTAQFSGNVIAKRGQEVFHADKINYNRDTGQIQSNGKLTYGTLDFAIAAQSADYSLDATSGHFTSLDYYLTKQQAQGSAATLTVNRKAQTEDLTEAVYTTCPRLKPNWFIKAAELNLNHETGIGQAWHTTFHVGKTPVFYLPYFSFPLNDERKTGFLMPSANLSESRGLDITTPFYINIAPNQDATLYPRLMSKRGLMLGAEYRYLLPQLSGTIGGYLLPEDFKDNGKRWSFKTSHRYQPLNNLSVTANYQRVSDVNYIEHFEDTLDLGNLNFLESHLTATYLPSKNYRIVGQFKDYQLANSNYSKADKPYSVLPRLLGHGEWQLDNGIRLGSTTELTNFDKDDAVSGLRFDQEVALSYLYETTYAFVKPRLAYRFTGYDLRDTEAEQAQHITRSLPTFSLDSGLFFDRDSSWFGRGVTQTLEPRLFYLYTPYQEQSDIPDFDTADIDSSYDAMFLNNRFNGKDRIGDANQLTTAVSTRFIDNDNGKELAELSVGQIQYFADRRVSLNDSIASRSRSNVLAEGHLVVNDHVKARGLIHHNIDSKHTEKSALGITYAPAIDKAISLTHLYDDDVYEQLDFTGVWRIDERWRTFWRWNYSLEYSKTIDMIAGVEYADCCWGIRLLARQQRDNLVDNSDANSSIYLEFALKGLGNIGSDTGKLLSNIIPYYRPIDYEEK